MQAEEQISLDSFSLGQDIRDIVKRLQQEPRVTKVLDDGVVWYETKQGTDFKTKIGSHDLVAIRGSRLKVRSLGTVAVDDTPEDVMKILGKPTKIQDLPDTLIQDNDADSSESDQIIRLEYQIGNTHIKICFFGKPGIREIVVQQIPKPA